MASLFTVNAEELSNLVKNHDSGSQKEIEDNYGGWKGLCEKLNTDANQGLPASEAQNQYHDRLAQFGPNVVEEKEARSWFSFFFDALGDKTLIILMIAAIVSIALGLAFPPPDESRSTAWIEGAAILIAVFCVSSVTSTNDYSKDKRFRALSALSEDRKVKVIRAGEKKVISTSEVLVGDIVLLDTGDWIPGDMYFISGQSLSVDESAMTGEPDAVRKSPQKPFLFSGCMVMEGTGKGIVMAVGPYSQWGRIKASLTKEAVKTPLQERLEDMAELIGKLGLVAAVVTFIAIILRWTIQEYGVDNDDWKWSDLSKLVDAAIISITIIVVAVPEGLPLAVTMALVYSMIQMMKDQNLVRHLAACETMGGATCICSDKTGTLTQNKMTVMKVWVGAQLFDSPPASGNEVNAALLNPLCEGMSINSTAYIDRTGSKTEFVGAKTECALLVFSEQMGFNYEDIRNRADIITQFPFSSKKKRMSTLIGTTNGSRLYCKGASEVLLDLSTHVLDKSGNPIPLEEDQKKDLLKLIEDWAGDGYRTLCLCYRDFPEKVKADIKEDTIDTDFTLIGIVGIEDPLRPEVPASVKQCKDAGITVRMLTGDNILTAKNIARKCGILTDGIAIEGPKFRKLSTEEIDRLIPKLQIIARCSPEDKLILVTRLGELGEVVAVTGDGTNDAPSLKQADVGFAMGIMGTEVAKSAADIILMDDNFSSIEKAVLWGRNVYDSIRKFVQFQLTVNVVAVVVAFVGAVIDGETPLKAVQLLWVNLIMDTFAALALATEPPRIELFNRPPHGRNSPLITYKMWRLIAGQAIFQLAVLFWILKGGKHLDFLDFEGHHGDDRKITVIFNTFVFMQLFNEINCRRLEDEKNVFQNFFANWIFIAVIIGTAIVQFLLVQFCGAFAKTTALDAGQWFFCIGIGAFSIPWAIVLRFIPVPDEHSRETKVPVDALSAEEAETLLAGKGFEMKEGTHHENNNNNFDTKGIAEGVGYRSPQANWGSAAKVLTQIKVVSAFRRAVPGTQFD